MRPFLSSVIAACALLLSVVAAAQPTTLPHPPGFEYWPGADYDPAVPTTQAVLGHAVGEDIALSADVRRYFDALAAALPDRVRVVDYGRSWEGRPLWYAVVGSAANVARADAVAAAMRELADPRVADRARAEAIIRDMPAVVWLGYSVHGNEPGTTDAAMQTAYHLLASRGDARVPAMLENTLAVIVPVQNPDGRDRFIHANRAARGPFPDGDFLSAERDEPWPGGRMNHYVFDLNRDWFAQTQPETRLLAPELLRWMPVVVLDVHEMGTDLTYFFPPEAEPFNPNLTRTQLGNADLIGANNARWFDRFGLPYFTREIFDAFYPGYGSGWPNYHGMTAVVYEQGSSRGLVARRRDGTTLSFRDTVQSQFVAGLSAIEVVASNRAKFLGDFRAYRESAIDEGRREKTRAYIVPATGQAAGALKLAGTLVRNGIEVRRADAGFSACGARYDAGAYIVDSAQPAKRLLRTLMDIDTPMDAGFVARQRERLARGLPDEIYDVTAWSLPLMYGVDVATCGSVPEVAATAVGAEIRAAGRVVGSSEAIAWIVPWGDVPAVRFLAGALRAGVDVDAADDGFTHDGTTYPSGSLIVRRAGNIADVAAQVAAIAEASGATVTAVGSSGVSVGPDFGSPRVVDMPAPRIALVWDQPAERYSAGWARFLVEREFEYPVTLIRGARIAGADLSRYDVLVLPGEGQPYRTAFGDAGVANLKSFVQRGGVLVTLGSATRFAADPAVDLVALRREDGAHGDADAKDADKAGNGATPATVPGSVIKDPEALDAATRAQVPLAVPVSGAIVRASVDAEHWFAAGLDAELSVLVSGGDIYAPIKRDQGATVLRFAAADRLRLAGVLWDETRDQLAFKPFVVVQPVGAGMVVAFTQDPNVRAYFDGLAPLYANALFRAPAKSLRVR
jgi:hypothetical protein